MEVPCATDITFRFEFCLIKSTVVITFLISCIFDFVYKRVVLAFAHCHHLCAW